MELAKKFAASHVFQMAERFRGPGFGASQLRGSSISSLKDKCFRFFQLRNR
jgi:hypothetical protein